MAEDELYAGAEPLTGQVRVGERRNWLEAGLEDAAVLEADLATLELSTSQIKAILRERQQTQAQLAEITYVLEQELWDDDDNYDEPADAWESPCGKRRTVKQRFFDRLAGRRFGYSDVTEHEVRVPLFVLAAPEPAGCSATFSQDVMAGRALAWNVTLFGSGLGGSSSFRVTSTWKFQASAGDSKQVFLPVTVTVATVRVMVGERVVTTTRQVVASDATPAKQPGLTLLRPGVQEPAGEVICEYPLAGDTTGAIATYGATYARTSSGRVELGAEAFGVGATLSADVSFDQAIALDLELRGGHDYSLHRLRSGQGMAWSVAPER
ncbi:hypothetical protein ACWEOO_01235 [Kribbella sp. NPDC004138]